MAKMQCRIVFEKREFSYEEELVAKLDTLFAAATKKLLARGHFVTFGFAASHSAESCPW